MQESLQAVALEMAGLRRDLSLTAARAQEATTFEGLDTSCQICQSEYQRGEAVLRLACRHVYHRECWGRYMVSTARNRHSRPARRNSYCTLALDRPRTGHPGWTRWNSCSERTFADWRPTVRHRESTEHAKI